MPRERAKERACDKAIKNTLAYRAVFKYPLSYFQLHNTLISSQSFEPSFLDKELNKLIKKGYIGFRDGKYFDKSIKPVSWDFRYKLSLQAIDKAKQVCKYLAWIPWIKMICITGSAAAFNSDRDSDIDIFVVAKTHRLWLVRGFVSLILKKLNMYAQGGVGPSKICPNLFIDEENFDWPADQRSIFTAHEIVLMHPIFDKDNTYFKFLKANNWIKEYFPNFKLEYELNNKTKKTSESRIVNAFEKLARYLQLKYMAKKRTSEVTDEHMLHFKKNDNTKWILEEFGKKCR